MAPFSLSGAPTVAQMTKCQAESTGRHNFEFGSESINKLDCFKE
jgi:hypothetical protein